MGSGDPGPRGVRAGRKPSLPYNTSATVGAGASVVVEQLSGTVVPAQFRTSPLRGAPIVRERVVSVEARTRTNEPKIAALSHKLWLLSFFAEFFFVCVSIDSLINSAN